MIFKFLKYINLLFLFIFAFERNLKEIKIIYWTQYRKEINKLINNKFIYWFHDIEGNSTQFKN
jgi:hypothetical protein